MATGILVPRLLEKLVKLRNLPTDEVVVDGGLKDRIRRIIMEVLESIPRSIRDAENRLISSHGIDESLREFLRKLDLIQDITHTLLLKKEQQRQQKEQQRQQKSLIKKMFVCPLILQSSEQDQIRLINQMEEFLTYAKVLYDKEEHREPPRDADMRPQLQDDDSDIVGFEKEAEELADKLISRGYDKRPIIAVVGKAGSGKTTLTKKVYDRADIQHHFKCCAWVSCRPNEFTETELLVHIWTQIKPETAVKNLPGKELRERVKKILEEKTTLLVIDDIWFDTPRLEFLCFSESMRSATSRIVVTVRENESLPQGVATIRLRSLTDEESWRLFLKKASIAEDSRNDHPVLIKFKETILRKCDGWALAIALLGGLLSTRDLSEWSSVIEHRNFQQISVLALSYQDLPCQMKSCFLFLGLFPREFEISLRRLFHLWVAEGLVTVPDDEKHILAPEDVAEKYFKVLVRRNMIQVSRLRFDGSPKTCRVPGNQWDVLNVIRKALNANSHLFKYSSFYYPISGVNCPQKLLLYEIKRDRDFRSLSMLDLEGYCTPVLLIPKSLGKLVHLKYLGLRRTFLYSIPVSVGDLPNLETLDIKHTRITTLVDSSIWKAKNLRHLYMNNIHFPVPCREKTNTDSATSSGSLTNLQTLWGLFIGDECPMVMDCLNKSTGLRKLGLTFDLTSAEAEKIFEWVSHLTNLQSLRLRSSRYREPSDPKFIGTFSKHNKLTELYLLGNLQTRFIEVDRFPPNLKILTLSVSQLEEDPMPVLGKLRHLNILRLYGNSYLGTKMICLSDGFPELRILKLWALLNLVEWNVEQGAMPRLRELEIRSCNIQLVVNGLQKVTTLKDIILTKAPMEFVADVVRFMEMDVSITKVKDWNSASF